MIITQTYSGPSQTSKLEIFLWKLSFFISTLPTPEIYVEFWYLYIFIYLYTQGIYIHFVKSGKYCVVLFMKFSRDKFFSRQILAKFLSCWWITQMSKFKSCRCTMSCEREISENFTRYIFAENEFSKMTIFVISVCPCFIVFYLLVTKRKIKVI